MKNKLILKVIGLIAIFLSVTGCDQLSYADTSSDCIIKNMKGVTTDHAANFTYQACREEYPVAKTERALSDAEVKSLTGRAALNLTDEHYSGYIYNGNTNLTVSQITITITAKKSDGGEISKKYLHNLSISPLSRSDFRIEIMPESETIPIIDPFAKKEGKKNQFSASTRIKAGEYTWYISDAIGYL
ncbi:hypothetical protein PNIG_a1556 [Pseudoalteromonas nigrifaciens]|uniref:Lipoprotein n=1 Tax=Pseudoalteromonas nigrifaciens TaxID=28109 RepID=A0AAC9XXK4_9GAMM|nr:hypothetical protein [Pseudoalteromonas nigrifaciens]ASM53703.1 hypothetical protein PNIG_a1556 [Pseudoalteromonas nigrifaciens]GEN40696.1 hypothetical protein PNI02_01620 [Pseudoalteromonas nigrifaciens]SUC52454.1 Uncharacterised protein [Pseudoalteromonas nigrifaciens]